MIKRYTIGFEAVYQTDKPFDEIPKFLLVGKLREMLQRIEQNEQWDKINLLETHELLPLEDGIYRCTWCCRDTTTKPCEHCENIYTVVNRLRPHRPEWSRATIKEVECKVCDRRGPYSIQQSHAWCDERNNPDIKGIHDP